MTLNRVMSFSFINTLSESKLFPTKSHVEQRTSRDVANIGHATMCALRILLADKDTKEWAEKYCAKTRLYGDFKLWRASATDLYAIMYALLGDEEMHGHDIRRFLNVDKTLLFRWLREQSGEQDGEITTRRIFINLDNWFYMDDTKLRAIRRLILDWDNIEHFDRSLAVTRLIQYFKNKAPYSEVLPHLQTLAKKRDLIFNEDETEHSKSLLIDLAENSTAGATSASSVASVPGGLGLGFDPNGTWRSIYGSKKVIPSKKKSVILRRSDAPKKVPD